MKRENLITQVKEAYANIASSDSQRHFDKTTTGLTAETYYENLQNAVITEINNGTFDNCRSGIEIVNRVAADKTLLSNWGNNNAGEG
ncbi:MAG: hypothetical protein FWE91_07185 [Defluviitaleaceae bacterium]|nr:hypothetical protein [Defluviitaleaceae bacterium]MCL2836562.1 hypothetical protein [Defluviitaleaceae bacterium]